MDTLEALGTWARLGPDQLAKLAHVSRRTAYRWIQTGLIPSTHLKWLHLAHYGELGTISKTWQGWRLYLSGLCSPSGLCFTPADIEVIPTLHTEHRLQRIELLQLRARETTRLDIERKTFQLNETDHNEPASHLTSNSRLARI